MYEDFLAAGQLIASQTGLANPKPKKKKMETPNIGSDYLLFYQNKEGYFNFCLRSDVNTEDLANWSSLALSLYFYNNFDLCQFSAHELFKSGQ